MNTTRPFYLEDATNCPHLVWETSTRSHPRAIRVEGPHYRIPLGDGSDVYDVITTDSGGVEHEHDSRGRFRHPVTRDLSDEPHLVVLLTEAPVPTATETLDDRCAFICLWCALHGKPSRNRKDGVWEHGDGKVCRSGHVWDYREQKGLL